MIMLSDRSEYEGGIFQTRDENNVVTDYELQRGEAIVFNSGKCVHRVTPVTKYFEIKLFAVLFHKHITFFFSEFFVEMVGRKY